MPPPPPPPPPPHTAAVAAADANPHALRFQLFKNVSTSSARSRNDERASLPHSAIMHRMALVQESRGWDSVLDPVYVTPFLNCIIVTLCQVHLLQQPAPHLPHYSQRCNACRAGTIQIPARARSANPRVHPPRYFAHNRGAAAACRPSPSHTPN